MFVRESDMVLEELSVEWKVMGVWCDWCELLVKEVVLMKSDGEEEMVWMVCVYCVDKKRKEVVE